MNEDDFRATLIVLLVIGLAIWGLSLINWGDVGYKLIDRGEARLVVAGEDRGSDLRYIIIETKTLSEQTCILTHVWTFEPEVYRDSFMVCDFE